MTGSRARGAQRARRAMAALLIGGAVVAGALPPAHGTPGAPGDAGSWLAIGDSISSGYGIPSVSGRRSVLGHNCARADGEQLTTAEAGVAWPVAAQRVLAGQGVAYRQVFTACAGQLTDDWAVQVAEAYQRTGVTLSTPIAQGAPSRESPLVTELDRIAASGQRFDVVTFTFGANNVGLGLFGQGCIDQGDPDGSPRSWTSAGWGGCDAGRSLVQQQVDLLVGRTSPRGDARMLAGVVPLWTADGQDPASAEVEPLLSAIGRFVVPGGSVYVVGYPQIVEEAARSTLSRRWSGVPGLTERAGNCEGVSTQAAGHIRHAIGYLNTGIGEATAKADAAWGSRGVRFEFVDPNPLAFETDAGRHGLCTAEPWINDPFITTGGTLHPNAEGHRKAGEAFAAPLHP